MPMLKIGANYYNGEERPIYLIQGNATRDGEWAPVNGKDHGKVSVAAAQRSENDTVFVTLNGWREKARDVAAILKMDSVLAIGTLKIREYNGKQYCDLDVDFLCVSGISPDAPLPGAARTGNPVGVPFSELPPDEEPGQLPF